MRAQEAEAGETNGVEVPGGEEECGQHEGEGEDEGAGEVGGPGDRQDLHSEFVFFRAYDRVRECLPNNKYINSKKEIITQVEAIVSVC